MTFLFTGVILDIAQVFSFFLIFFCDLGGIDPNSWMASLPFSLMLLGAKSLSLRLINGRKSVVGFNFFFVFVSSLIALLPIGIMLIFFD